MAGDDRHSRPTRPPAAPAPHAGPAHEDSPPLVRQRGPVPPRELPETIAKIAARAPQQPALTEHEEMMRALAQVSHDREIMETKLRAELRDLIVERQPLPSPPKLPAVDLAPPPSQAKRFSLVPKSMRDMSWMAHMPATLMAIAALITTVAQSCVKKQELSSDALAKIQTIHDELDAHVKAHNLADVATDAKKKADYKYQLEQRNWLAPVLEKLSVKVDDPPGAPPRADMGFYPQPSLGSHAPRIQPNATFPAPPAP